MVVSSARALASRLAMNCPNSTLSICFLLLIHFIDTSGRTLLGLNLLDSSPRLIALFHPLGRCRYTFRPTLEAKRRRRLLQPVDNLQPERRLGLCVPFAGAQPC